jgi:hypothetical protein
MAKTTKTDSKIIAAPASFSFEQVVPHAIFEPIASTKFSFDHLQIQSPFSIRRLSKGDDRWYSHEIQGSDERRYCMSVTTFVGKSMGLDRNLMSYFMRMGKEAADMHLHIAAEYGSYFHIEAGEFLKSGEYDFGYNGFLSENKTIEYMAAKLKIPSEKMQWYWIERIQKDMASFITFCEEREVRPVAIECPIISYDYPLGSVIDLVCQCKFDGEVVNAIVDYKTGENFYKEHEFQLQLYKKMWNEHFGDIFPITHIFNWKPNDWDITKKPTFTFKNQTDCEKVDIESRLKTAIAEGMFKAPKPKFLMEGKYVSGKGEIASHIKLKDYLTIMKDIAANENK